MRGRAVSLILIGLGAFLLAGALAVRLVLAPDFVKLPLDQEAEPSATGTGLTYFSLADMEQVRDDTGSVSQRVQGDPTDAEAGDDVAVWHFGSVIESSSGDQINISEYTVCIDRKTAESVTDCDAADIEGDDQRKPEGLTLTFPFDTQKQDYLLFNASAGQSFPAAFVEEEEIDGLTVYRFEQQIPETVVRTVEVPGELAGVPDEANVEADFVYTNTRTLWVEPLSGVIIKAEETPDTVVTAPDGSTGVTWLKATFAADDETTAAGLERAKDTRTKILWVETYGPILLGVLGALLLAVGILLSLRSRRTPQHRYEDAAEEPVPAEVR
jgi:hypothetical protein